MESFCINACIAQEFSTPITPQQNGVIERKNKVIQEMARSMLHNKDVAFILKDRENVGKFDTRSDEGILLGYSSTSKAYKVLNKRTRKVMETVNVVIDEASTLKSLKATKQMPKSVLPLTLDSDQEVGDKNPSPPTSFSVIQGPKDSSTSL